MLQNNRIPTNKKGDKEIAMSEKNARFFKCCFLLSAAILAVFLVELIFFYDFVLAGDPLSRYLTEEEWNWLIARPSKSYEPIVLGISTLVSYFFWLLSIVCIGKLLSAKEAPLRIRRSLKIGVPLLGILLYTPVYYYVKYKAVHYRLYMTYLPLVFFSIILLTLTCIALKNARNSPSEETLS